MLIGYMRVSSETDRQNTDLQRDALLKAGVDPRHIFEDRASGARDDREGLQKAIDYIAEGDCLIVWKLDRLGRSLPHLLSIMKILKEKGVGFRSLTEQMDTTTPHGELIFNIFGSLSQYERKLAKERIMAGLEAARKRGKRGGRAKAINDDQMAGIITDIKANVSKAAICRKYGVKRSTLYLALQRQEVEMAKSSTIN